MSSAPAHALASAISAIQVLKSDDGGDRMGLLTQIRPDPSIEVCGPGFNDKTVKVNFHGGAYFVFRQDLDLRFGMLPGLQTRY
jgi:hypothetical protein